MIATTGSVCDVAERALFACGRALTVAELASLATSPSSASGDATAELWPLLARDRRFVRVGADRFRAGRMGQWRR